jgi:malate dehydrogenase (oxaloacetate-decarboxylating)
MQQRAATVRGDVPPGGSYTLTVRTAYPNTVGMLGKIASVIGREGGDIGAVDIVQSTRDTMVRDISFTARDIDHAHRITEAIKSIEKVSLRSISDPVFLLHLGGKIEVTSRVPLNTRGDLSAAYTPGVARICQAIYHEPVAVWSLTVKGNSVAVVTDGTAVLGLGDIGPLAALPVMEGKAILFKEFGGVDAWPICLNTKDTDEIVQIVKAISPVFGGINLEDIAAPRCFEIEARLKEELDIPVFHDDQHGTAVVVLAGLINALKIVGKRMEDLRVVFLGVGAAGVACSKILMSMGVKDIIGLDRAGALYKGRTEHMNSEKLWYAENTNPRQIKGDLSEAMRDADVFIGLSGPGMLTVDHLKIMARDPIVFAMANPDPEIMPEEAEPYVRVMATGRSDYPNQINNVLCFPGFFRGLLDAHATTVNEEMKIAAAEAIASQVSDRELHEEYIIPSVFNRHVARAVARAVTDTAYRTGAATRHRRSQTTHMWPA